MRGDTVLENRNVRLKNCRYGPMLYLPADQYIGQALDKYGEFSEGETFFFRNIVQPDWTVLDIGANQGGHTIALAQIARTVHAFEPQRILFQILCANVALNALSNVYTHQVAVGQRGDFDWISVPPLDYATSANFGAVEMGGLDGEKVPLITIDSLNLPACHFMKIDVEGMEQDVVEGGESTITKHQPIIYVENDRPDKSSALISCLFRLGYRCYWHMPYYYNVHNYFGNQDNVYGRTISVNMLCVHKSQPQDIKLKEVLTPVASWRDAL